MSAFVAQSGKTRRLRNPLGPPRRDCGSQAGPRRARRPITVIEYRQSRIRIRRKAYVSALRPGLDGVEGDLRVVFKGTACPPTTTAASEPSLAIQAAGGAGLGHSATANAIGSPIQRSTPRHRQAKTIPMYDIANAIVGADDMVTAAPGAFEKTWPMEMTLRAARPATA